MGRYAIVVRNWKSADIDGDNIDLSFGVIISNLVFGWKKYKGGIDFIFFNHRSLNYQIDIINKRKRPELLRCKWGCEIFTFNC